MSTFVDSCVLLDLIENDPVWADWSQSQLEKAATRGPMIINVAVYAEIANSFASESELEAFVRATELQVKAIPRGAAWLAANAHRAYRRSKGTKTTTLPDFFIGAHAQLEGHSLLTRDATRFKTYFPLLKLIVPKNG
ncbi:MAG: PIN domain-containing protein [Burkholderiales bacterium]|nr:MAG: PIN domain-containing protein [Burkholderiales bacterium]